MPEIIAALIVIYRPSTDADWEEIQRVHLDLPTIRIGRAKDSDIMIDLVEIRQGFFHLIFGTPTQPDLSLFARIGNRHFISRRHATMFKWEEFSDYEIMDGTPGDATLDNPDPKPILSACGVFVNAQKLEPGQKQILKNKDEIHLVKGILKMVYLRPHNKIVDALDDTYLPGFTDAEQAATTKKKH